MLSSQPVLISEFRTLKQMMVSNSFFIGSRSDHSDFDLEFWAQGELGDFNGFFIERGSNAYCVLQQVCTTP